MGYRTPNIDRIANEGVAFTDYYGQQSCTAGRAAFITGQNPIRTGLTKVGMPGADVGLQAEDPTIAELLKPLGYATASSARTTSATRTSSCRPMHGFDEFFGNLYHLNAEEEPETPRLPQGPRLQEALRPARRHALPGPTARAAQKIENTGPLTIKRMETIDDEITDGRAGLHRQGARGRTSPSSSGTTPPPCTSAPTSPRSTGARAAQGDYNDRMVEHDEHIGKMLDKLDELGIADDTIVMYSTDNGPHYNSWPDAGITPFADEKNTNWEGGWRVPAFVRWPGKFKAGTVLNGIVTHQDWLPTLLAAAGEPDIKEKLLAGYKVGDKTFKVHLDGFNMLPYFTGEVKESPRQSFFYFSDDGDVIAMRIGDWKDV